jgi:DNA-binding GntR family transcriptional regulator
MSSDPLLERLRRDITNGTFQPNERLIEADLVNRYETSRAALRNAFVALEKERLLEREPNRGARVRSIPLAEAIEATEIRALLEGFCASLAAQHVTESESAELRRIVEEMRAHVAGDDSVGYAEANERLHRRIYEIARHRTATETLDRLHLLTIRHQFSVQFLPRRPAQSLPEHEAIVRAIVKNDARAARIAAEKHVSSVIGALQQVSRLTGIGR